MGVIKPPYIGGFCKRKIIVVANIVRCYNKCITKRTHCVKGVLWQQQHLVYEWILV